MSRRWPGRIEFKIRKFLHSLLPLVVLMLAALMAASALYLRTLATELAVSAAQDTVSAAVAEIVKSIVGQCEDELIVLQRNDDGSIAAVTTDIAAVNGLSGDILSAVTAATEDHYIEISIPLGSLSGSALLLSRGPNIKIRIQVLSSTFSGFRTELNSLGINQTRHQILLELQEELTLLMPWHTVDTSVETEIPLAETVIVGQVPQSYFYAGDGYE